MRDMLKNAFCVFLAFICGFYAFVPAFAVDSLYEQMCKNVEEWQKFPHPYLLGSFSEDTGEVMITGFKPNGVDPESHYYLYDYNSIPNDIVIPNEINGYPVTEIAAGSFCDDEDYSFNHAVHSVVIGDHVRRIGNHAFGYSKALETVVLGKNVEVIGAFAFAECDRLRTVSWGESLREIQDGAFMQSGSERDPWPPLPDTIETVGDGALDCPDRYVIPASMKKINALSFWGRSFVVLSKDMQIEDTAKYPLIPFYMSGLEPEEYFICCYTGSTAEENALIHGYTYYLIDGDSLLWDGETIAGNVLPVRFGMTEEELRSHLSVDGASSEIQIDGLQDGKVVNGTTVTLFHTVAQAPGKVYTVEKKAEPVSVSVETLPTKIYYFYKEAFDPSGLSLRVTYDDGTETVVTDGISLTGTDLTVGTNTITATYENCSTTFTVTVRLPQAVRVSVETLPTKTNYFYKEAFDPSGLSLRVAYDDGTETVVTDGVACTGTDLTVGTNTITATVENQSVTFPVTVRYSWWQTLIRIFLFGFLWY